MPGMPHHVTQRGNRREPVFFVDRDRLDYMSLLGRSCQKHGVAIWAYCLMSNHVHLVAVPSTEQSLGLALRDAHTAYTLRFNRRNSLCGHLWQGRFYSTVLDDLHLYAAVRYVERNPVRAGMVERAEMFRWSGAASHCGLRQDPLLHPGFPPPEMAKIVANWQTWLHDEQEADLETLRSRTRTGRPCGGSDFIAKLESLLGRSLGPAKRGPKPKP
jgi:putative transposase